MAVAKVFRTRCGQAIRLPKAFRVETDTVHLKRTSEGFLVITRVSWEILLRRRRETLRRVLETRVYPARAGIAGLIGRLSSCRGRRNRRRENPRRIESTPIRLLSGRPEISCLFVGAIMRPYCVVPLGRHPARPQPNARPFSAFVFNRFGYGLVSSHARHRNPVRDRVVRM